MGWRSSPRTTLKAPMVSSVRALCAQPNAAITTSRSETPSLARRFFRRPHAWDAHIGCGPGTGDLRSRRIGCGDSYRLGSRCDGTCCRTECSQTIRGDGRQASVSAVKSKGFAMTTSQPAARAASCSRGKAWAVARSQLLLPVSDNYFCRRRGSKGVSPTTWRHSVVVVGRSVAVTCSAGAPTGAEAPAAIPGT